MSLPRSTPAARVRAYLTRWTALFVWLACIVALIALASPWRASDRLPALVHTTRCSVIVPCDGRVARLAIALHDSVTAGQVVARLDDADLQARLRAAQATLEELRAELLRETAELQLEDRSAQAEHELATTIEHRRLVSALGEAMLDVLETRTQLEEARVRLAGSQIDAERVGKLAGQGISGEPELVRVRTERDALQKRVSELENLQDQRQAFATATERRLQQFQPTALPNRNPESHLAPLQWRLQAHGALLDKLAVESRDLDLRAPMAGRVETLTARIGEVVRAGHSLATVVDPVGRHIVGYLPPSLLGRAQPTAIAHVLSEDDELLGEAPLLSVSPAAIRMPSRLWRVPGQEEWAFEVLFGVTGKEAPGQALQLVLR